VTFSQRSANSSNRSAARSLRAPRPRARRRVAAASAWPPFRDFSQPAGLLGQLEHLALGFPRTQRIVRVAARSARPIDRDRSRTRTFLSRATPRACGPPARAPAPHATPTPRRSGTSHRPRSSWSRSQTARGRNRRSSINARDSSSTVAAPIRRVSLRTVDSSGTRATRLIRQNRRR
jgi:hypothetical protein